MTVVGGPTSRRSGLYGPTAIPSRSDISNGNGAPPAMSDLKAPTYKNTPRTVVNGPTSRRSGLYGSTAILSRSDISNGNGAPPAMSDLKAPTYKRHP